MKRIAAIAIMLLSSSQLSAAQQQPSSWTSGIHHLKVSISSTASKSVKGMKTMLHLDTKKSK